jgi:hypothetical protein
MLVDLSPEKIIEMVSIAMPQDSKKNIIVIGSLAAGHYFYDVLKNGGVRTKDVDCMIWPHPKVKVLAKNVAEQLMNNGWELNYTKEYPLSNDKKTPVEELPIIRLHPKEDNNWFLELLNSPNTKLTQKSVRSVEKVKTKYGYFALCGFKYLSLVEVSPIQTQYQIAIARPEMMALANLLHHPVIGNETIGTTNIKRSNKDLGRVLALAYLMTESKKDLREWPRLWLDALEEKFPNEVSELSLVAGSGLKKLIQQEQDFEQAVKTCNDGLLANYNITSEKMMATALRFIDDVTNKLEELTK